MPRTPPRYAETPLVKTKIIATVGPACGTFESLKQLAVAGVDLFRLNFAHGEHDWLSNIVRDVHRVAEELQRPLGILGDLSGPKIRLGTLPEEGLTCVEGDRLEFVREADPDDPSKLTCTYDSLIDDLNIDDRVLLADGMVGLRVLEKPASGDRVVCLVDRSGVIRSRQGVNLPGVTLSTPSLTEKDKADLAWAVEHQLDYVGLSFVRSADDVKLLRETIDSHKSDSPPQIVAKIEKMEAVTDLDRILNETDAVMVARGDLGVEVDIARVPALQKRIVRLCNQHRVPVITATQMLESMTASEFPTRAEASDVANAVLDGSDAVMLSGESAVGVNPPRAVEMMSRICREAEQLVVWNRAVDSQSSSRMRATPLTEAVTQGATLTAEHLDADLLVVATHGGKTAMALSKQRSRIPILAITDRGTTARRMCLYWGVRPLLVESVPEVPQQLIQRVVEWGKREDVLGPGSRIVFVGTVDWTQDGKDLMLVHAVT
jgi:pyruvate kinase